MASIAPHLLPDDAFPERRRWTIDEFHRLDDAGLLGDGRFELLDGEIIHKMGRNEPDIACLRLSAVALRAALGPDFDVSQQLPLHLGEHDAPEPDVTVLRGTARDFDGRNPAPDDVALIVEVADSRLDTAKGYKVNLYARYGIVEYWVVDLRQRTLEVRRRPVDGRWSETSVVNDSAIVCPIGLQAEVKVADLLPRSR